MLAGPLPILTRAEPRTWIRLRTGILLRWLTVFGQSSGSTCRSALCFAAISAAALSDLASSRLPETCRLSEPEAALPLTFNLLQLGAPFYITSTLTDRRRFHRQRQRPSGYRPPRRLDSPPRRRRHRDLAAARGEACR